MARLGDVALASHRHRAGVGRLTRAAPACSRSWMMMSVNVPAANIPMACCAFRHDARLSVHRRYAGPTPAPHRHDSRGACSSVGQSGGLIIRWSQVRVLPGPPIHTNAYREFETRMQTDASGGRCPRPDLRPPDCRACTQEQTGRHSRLTWPALNGADGVETHRDAGCDANKLPERRRDNHEPDLHPADAVEALRGAGATDARAIWRLSPPSRTHTEPQTWSRGPGRYMRGRGECVTRLQCERRARTYGREHDRDRGRRLTRRARHTCGGSEAAHRAALGCRLSAELQHILLYSNDGSAVPVMRTAQRGTTMKWRLPQLAHVVLAGAGPFRAELIARAVGLPGLEAHQRTLVRGEVVRDLGAQAVREVQ